jgi:hypothetical protein
MTSIIKTRVIAHDSSIDRITVLRNLAKTRTSADLSRMFNVPTTTMSSYCARYGVYCVQIDRQTRGKLGYAKGIGKQRAA